MSGHDIQLFQHTVWLYSLNLMYEANVQNTLFVALTLLYFIYFTLSCMKSATLHVNSISKVNKYHGYQSMQWKHSQHYLEWMQFKCFDWMTWKSVSSYALYSLWEQNEGKLNVCRTSPRENLCGLQWYLEIFERSYTTVVRLVYLRWWARHYCVRRLLTVVAWNSPPWTLPQ